MLDILDHNVNSDRNHLTVKIDDMMCRIRWNEQPSSKDTLEPIHHLSRRSIVKYYEKRKLPYPNNIINAFALKRKSGEVKRVSTYKKHTDNSKRTRQVYDGDNDNSDKQDESDERSGCENDDEDDEFVMDRVITHRVNKNKKHQYSNVGIYLYCVRWFGYSTSDDTWKPVEYLLPSKVLQYLKRKKSKPPTEIEDAVDG